MRGWKAIFAGLLLLGGGALGGLAPRILTALVSSGSHKSSADNKEEEPGPRQPSDRTPDSALIQQFAPALVTLSVSDSTGKARDATGVVIDPSGRVATSYQAIERAGKVSVRLVIREYSDVTALDVPLGTLAAALKFRIEHLGIGDAAADIAGKDFDGKEFKLSDYRGGMTSPHRFGINQRQPDCSRKWVTAKRVAVGDSPANRR